MPDRSHSGNIADLRERALTVILIDEEDRENEGDLVVEPSASRPRRSTSLALVRAVELICMPITKNARAQLNLAR
jgi:3,4-dihydroxy-2-butanone 4-phosphate synthase